MKFLVLSVVFSLCAVRAKLEHKLQWTNDCVQGYYWREYTGDIPKDAIPGGLDANGAAIYIGQVLDGAEVLPGQIREAEKSVIYYDQDHEQHVSTKRIKILCGHTLDDFEWIETNNSKIKDLTDKHFIQGGYPENIEEYSYYIGRFSKTNGEVLVGMIIVSGVINELGLHVVGDGKANLYSSYEVLTYNPKVHVSPESAKKGKGADVDSEAKFAWKTININIS